MRALKFLYILIFCSLIFNIVLAQNEENQRIISNIEVFENALKKSYRTIEDRIILLGKEKVYFFQIDAKSEVTDFFINGMRRFLGDYKIITEDSDKRDYSIILKNIRLEIKYIKAKSDILLNKKYERKVIFAFDIILRDKELSEVFSKSISDNFEDILYSEYISDAELSGYSFTKGQIPEESLFEKLLIPGVILAASAVAIVLFFIIRSK